MLNPRILMILSDLPDAETALNLALDALAMAARPFGLRFAVPEPYEEAFRSAQLPQNALSARDVLFYREEDGLAALTPRLTDETHALALRGGFAFAERWDATLCARFAKIGERRAVMTAALTGEGRQAQACLPAFTGDFGADSASLGAGLALVCAAAPVRTLLIHPAFLFSGVAFLRDAYAARDTLSIAAYAAGYAVFALDTAPLWPTGGAFPAARLTKPGPELLPPTGLARFEQAAGISFERGEATVRACHGLFGVEDVYAQRLPPRLNLRRHAAALLPGARPELPLFVTAFIDQPEALRPPVWYMIRFAFLKAVRALPLTLYAGGEMERRLRAGFPNTLAYPDQALLPRTLLGEGMTRMQLFQRNKLPLLQRTQRAYPSFTHVAWLDIDALSHPVCPDATPDFTRLMDSRVHIGWVDGAPDTSLMVVPRRHLGLLAREVEAVTQFDAALKRGFSERDLIRRILEKYPDLFTLHPLPRKGLLFFTGFDPALLSAPLRQALSALPQPIRVPPAAPRKERNPHD